MQGRIDLQVTAPASMMRLVRLLVNHVIVTIGDAVAVLFDRLFDRLNAGDAAGLGEICDSEVVVVADGVRFDGVDGVVQWMDASKGHRFAVREVAGELGETASAILSLTDGQGLERRELVQVRFDENGSAADRIVMRPAGTGVRTFALLSSKQGLSRDEFLDYYERHHVPLIRSLAPVPLSYTRTYLPDVADRRVRADFDVVTQMRFADAEAQAEWVGLVTAQGSGVAEDEARFLDRSRTRSWVVRVEGDTQTIRI